MALTRRMTSLTNQISDIVNGNVYEKICLISERFNINRDELLAFLSMKSNATGNDDVIMEKREIYSDDNIEDQELVEDRYEYSKE